MRCKTCDYLLWNLREHRCPECGTPCLPSEHEFVLNSVAFCCPHCDQAYYGTGEKGHLEPLAFDCVSCGRHIHMDEMVLRPAEGLDNEETETEHVPWLERERRGRVKAWFSTVGMALVAPIRLMRAHPGTSDVGAAWWFAIVTNMLVGMGIAVVFLPFIVLPVVFSFAGGTGPRGGGAAVLRLCGGAAGVLALLVGLAVVGIGLWGLVAHGLLRLVDRPAGTLGRTYQALCYSAGANVTSALPCVGMYFGWIWWVVSAVLMVKERQQVHGGRAAFAVATPPVAAVLAFIGLYAALIAWGLSAGTRARALAPAMTRSQSVLSGIVEYAGEHDDRGPDHAIQLVSEYFINAQDLVTSESATVVQDVPVGDTDLQQVEQVSTSRQISLVQTAIDALPSGTIAHRLGDFVFTYHGIDLENSDPELWLVIESWDPDAGTMPPAGVIVHVGHADGTVSQFAVEQFATRLAEQNDLRRRRNLPPLPDPRSVTHGHPAIQAQGRCPESLSSAP